MSYYQTWVIRMLILIARILVSNIDTSMGSGSQRPELELSMLEKEAYEVTGVHLSATFKMTDGQV